MAHYLHFSVTEFQTYELQGNRMIIFDRVKEYMILLPRFYWLISQCPLCKKRMRGNVKKQKTNRHLDI